MVVFDNLQVLYVHLLVSDSFAKVVVGRDILLVKDEHVFSVKEKKRLLSAHSCMELFLEGSLERIFTDFVRTDACIVWDFELIDAKRHPLLVQDDELSVTRR